MACTSKMGWIRLLEKVQDAASTELYCTEYEVATETPIPGIFTSGTPGIICGYLCLDKDERGLVRYTLRIADGIHGKDSTLPNSSHEHASSDGYFFPGGVASELLALFSVYFRTRFYLVSFSFGELTNSSIRTKHLNPVRFHARLLGIYKEIIAPFHDPERNWSVGLSEFLDKASMLPPEKHQAFALACHNYHLAMQMVGIDYQLMYIHLVSAIECIMPDPKELDDDVFSGVKSEEICRWSELEKEGFAPEVIKAMREQFEDWYTENRRLTARFVQCVYEHAAGCVPETAPTALTIGMKDLKKVLKAIYAARSKYLHMGVSMYLPAIELARADWDILPMSSTVHDQKKRLSSEALPFPHFFEKLVRHVLIGYLEKTSQFKHGS